MCSSEGTAQGSVIGPLHFLSYVNDMNEHIAHCTCYQFADDTCLVAADDDPDVACALIQADFDSLLKWCHDYGLVVNASKTKLLHIRSPYIKRTVTKNVVAHNHSCFHLKNSLSCSCPTIEVVNNHKYLGLIIDSHLSWSTHIENVCTKLRQFLANITILKDRMPYKVKLMLYNSLAESYVQYGLCSYGRTFTTYLNKIYDLQVRILSNIVSDKIRYQFSNDHSSLFKHCNVLPVHVQFKYMFLKQLFFDPAYQTVTEHKVCTRAVVNRHRCISSQPRTTNTYGTRTAVYIVPRLVNNLPVVFRDSLSTKNIKNKLKSYYLNSLKNY